MIRDEHEQILGRASERFNTVRDAHGNLASINSSDPTVRYLLMNDEPAPKPATLGRRRR